MNTVVIVVAVLALANTEAIDISKVKPFEELDIFWEQLDPQLQVLRPSSDERVVNGQEAKPHQFPFQAFLLIPINNTHETQCGGTVLTPNFVLSAAHCMWNKTFALRGKVILGAHNHQVVEASQQRHDIAAINIHPRFIFKWLSNDIATVRLSTPAVFNAFVQPIDIPAISDTRTFAGMTGIISGFGRTSDDEATSSNVVMYTSNPILPNVACQAAWAPINIGAQQICLSRAGNRTACLGDSGGPLTVRDNGRRLQVGITSFVDKSGCTSGLPSVFVRVSHYLQWIAHNSDVVLQS